MAKKKEAGPPESFDEVTPEIRAQLPYAREDYEHEFDPLGVTHRVLSMITDDVDSSAGNRPRNTIEALAWAMIPEPIIPEISGPSLEEGMDQVQEEVNKLVAAGFVAEHDDGTYALTDDGMVELCN